MSCYETSLLPVYLIKISLNMLVRFSFFSIRLYNVDSVLKYPGSFTLMVHTIYTSHRVKLY